MKRNEITARKKPLESQTFNSAYDEDNAINANESLLALFQYSIKLHHVKSRQRR